MTKRGRHFCVGLGLLVAWSGGTPAISIPDDPPPIPALDELHLRRWTIADGLISNTLNHVLQTREGYVWAATYEGLVRFDGHRFTIFDKVTIPRLAVPGSEPIELSTNGIYELVEDLWGRLWIGTQGGGVLIYEAGRFSRLPGTGALTAVRSLLIEGEAAGDTGRTVWIGTRDGLWIHRRGKLRRWREGFLPRVIVRDITRDGDGTLWLATEGAGLIRLSEEDGGADRVMTTADGLASDAVTSLLPRTEGGLWVGTLEGVSEVNGGVVKTADPLKGVPVEHLAMDPSGRLWLATERGLFRQPGDGSEEESIGGDRFERLSELHGETLRSLRAVTFSREGSVLLASFVGGLVQLRPAKVDNLSRKDGVASKRVNAVNENAAGEILLASDVGVVHRVDRDGGLFDFDLRQELGDIRLLHVMEDSRGGLWVSTFSGLLHLPRNGPRHLFTVADGLPTNQVRQVFEDRSGKLWIATRNGGLVWREGDGFASFDVADGLGSSFVLGFEEDHQGHLLLSVRGALHRLDISQERPRILRTWENQRELPGTLVFNAHAGEDGVVWAATNGGLAWLRGDEVRTLTTHEGLPIDTVFDVQAAAGALWLSSNIGLLWLDRAELGEVLGGERQRLDVRVFDHHDGMADRQCSAATRFLRAGDGRLWIATMGGVAMLDPDAIHTNEVPPPVVVQRLVADGRELELRSGMELAAGSKRLVFEVAALSFLEPSRVRLRYRLEGFEDDWREVAADRRIEFTNLGHGDYVLRVIAANDDGLWNEEGAELTFHLRPHLWQRGPVQALLVFAVLLLARTAYRRRMRAIHARARERETLIHELGEKNQELERFVYTVSHDLKSPLVTIKGFLGLLRRDHESGDGERMDRDIERIDQAAQQMALLLDDLLELSRIGRIRGHDEEIELASLAREAVALVRGPESRHDPRIEVADDLGVVVGDRIRLLEVFQNLVENAIKYSATTPAAGTPAATTPEALTPEPHVEVGLRRDGGEPVVYVRDNGPGIPPRYHDKVFGLFERLDPEKEGTGVGLAIVKRVIEVHGGRIWVESSGEGEGATFCFSLPRWSEGMDGSP